MAERLFRNQQAEIKKRLPDAEFIYIKSEDSIRQTAREKSGEFSHIIACGGDGTVSQVANGLVGTDAILGILPLGSGNDFARQIGLNIDFDQDFETLLKGWKTPLDVVKTQWGYFLNTFGIGADGLTNYYASRSRFTRGGLRYFSGGLKALIMARPFQVRIVFNDGRTTANHKVWMVTLANGTTEGGRYTISPDSEMNDGILEIIVVKDISRIKLIYEFIKLSLGIPFSRNVIIKYTTASGCTVEPSEPVKVHADGE